MIKISLLATNDGGFGVDFVDKGADSFRLLCQPLKVYCPYRLPYGDNIATPRQPASDMNVMRYQSLSLGVCCRRTVTVRIGGSPNSAS